MIISEETIRQAFEKHHDIYDVKQEWHIPYHVEQWQRARKSFEDNSFEAFQELYDELRSYWQVFRGSKSQHWEAKKVYSELSKLDKTFRMIKLSELDFNHLPGLLMTMASMADIKRNKDGPSLVAVSKFLHFWNPKLFVIIDRERMENYVFKHQWIEELITKIASKVKKALSESIKKEIDFKNSILRYLPILFFSSEVVRKNPRLGQLFYEYVTKYASGAQGLPDLKNYEAAAIEWLLLGLVELPPEGVKIANY